MENLIENLDSVKVIDSNIIDAIKLIRYGNKKRPDENTRRLFMKKLSTLQCNNHPSKNYLLGKQNKNLKLSSTIFIKFLFFHQIIALQKL